MAWLPTCSLNGLSFVHSTLFPVVYTLSLYLNITKKLHRTRDLVSHLWQTHDMDLFSLGFLISIVYLFGGLHTRNRYILFLSCYNQTQRWGKVRTNVFCSYMIFIGCLFPLLIWSLLIWPFAASSTFWGLEFTLNFYNELR